MFELNPLNLPDAMWQHVIMLVVAAIIGYTIGYRSSRGVAAVLEAELEDLDADLADCRDSKITTTVAAPTVSKVAVPPVVAAPAAEPIVATEPIGFIAPEPIDMVAAAPPATAAEVTDPLRMTPIDPDDLKIVEGIGPKIEQLLNKEGILTFRQLSEATNERLVDILRAAGPRYQMHDPESWPRQAEMAANGQWDELKAWQEILNKGRIA